MRLCRME